MVQAVRTTDQRRVVATQPAGTNSTVLIRTDSIRSVVSTSAGIRGPGGGSATYQTTNRSGGSLAIGTVVATHAGGNGVVAANSTNDQLEAVGIATSVAANLATITIQTDGPLELADWSSVVGSTLLAAKSTYFLSTVSGQLTTTPPSSTGNTVQRVGYSVTPTILHISIEPPIKL
jgi:hypothetical protein